MGRERTYKMDGNGNNRDLIFATFAILSLFGILSVCNGFSIQVPASRLAGLGFEPSSGDLGVNKRYKQEIPLSALLQRADGAYNIFKRTNANTKPATCTCTCETKPVDGGSAYKRLASRAQRRGFYSEYDQGYDQAYQHYGQRNPVKKTHKTHHETPATCTCTCETHPADEVVVKGSNPHQDASPSQQKQQDFDSIFWNDGEDYWGNPREKPEAAALTKHEQSLEKSEEENKVDGGWGHTSRYPWQNLPDKICYRDRCDKDSDCCMRFNLCDRSAKVCVDCWYGASCSDETNCCFKYPICKTETYPAHNGVPGAQVVTGKCVDKL